jgi:hypothetical protein
MILSVWYAILLGICFPVYFGLLIKCMTDKRLYPNFSIYRDTISEVQDTSMETSKYLNPAFALIGLALLPLPYYLMQVLPESTISTISIVVLYCNPIGLLILAIWPNFTNNMHYVGAGVAMGGSLLAMILLIRPILLSTYISDILIIIIIFALFICAPLVYSNAVYGSRAELIHNPNFWEWLEFFTLQAFILGIYINLILAL